MGHRICSAPGCELKHVARGYCQTHYKRVRKTGSPEWRPRVTSEQYEQLFWSKIDKTADCWLWTGTKTDRGYGRLGKRPAYRIAYELLVGPIPDGMHLDHICHNPSCVNPDHLRPTTPKQNQENHSGARKDSKSGVRGVSWDKSKAKWIVVVGHNRRSYKEEYGDLGEAKQAVIALRNRLHTHNDLDRGEAAA